MSGFPYTDETGRRINPKPLTFEILWLDYYQNPALPMNVLAIDEIRRRDLSDAITAASNQLKAAKGNARDAHGFFVRAKREEN